MYELPSLGVNAFAFSWRGEHAYAAPPVALILLAAKKIAQTNMTAVLVVPLWKSSRFWPFLFPDGKHACHMIEEFYAIDTKMDSALQVESALTVQIRRFLVLFLRGGIYEPWKVRFSRSSCILKLSNQRCECE